MKFHFLKIKALTMLAVVALTLTSCSQTYRFTQVMKVEAVPSQGLTQNDGFCYEDEFCKINYVFSNAEGNMAFSLQNKSNEILYFDLTKSFLIVNGMAHDYYQNRVWSQTNSNRITTGASVAMTSYLAISQGVTTNNTNSTTIGEQPIVAIPPHGTKVINEFTLTNETFLHCSLERFPEEKASIYLNKENTPLCFTNYLTYKQTHLKFKGIEMDGTLRSFVQKLEQQGLRYIGTQDKVAMLEGEFAATKGCTIIVSSFADRDQVNVVGVIFPEAETWNSLTNTYFNLKELLTEKYGRPESIERFTDREPYNDFLKFHAVLDDECQYISEFNVDHGKIQLTLVKSDYDKASVVLRYIDNANAQETRKKVMDDL